MQETRATSIRRGFTLLTTAISAIVIIGMLGLVIDLGIGYVARNEVQAFTDAAALAGAQKLDNSLAGITAAKAAVAGSPNRWYFGTKSLTGVVTEFSTNRTAWEANPGTGAGYKYVRVTAPANSLQTYFASVLGAPATMNVSALSVAGAEVPTSFPEGAFPFAPFAHDPAAAEWGYTKGDELTLLWPSSVNGHGGNKMADLCQSDRNAASLALVQAGTTAERGYIQDTSASQLRAAIEDDHMDYTVTLGQNVNLTGGVKTSAVYQSLNDRAAQDSDNQTTNYDTYIANHDLTPLRRVVIVPIIVDHVNPAVLGFAKVFLPPTQPHNPNKSKCATYIGPASVPTGNGANGANLVRLLE